MPGITIDYSRALHFISREDIDSFSEKILDAHDMLDNKTGPGNDFLGWVELPKNYDREEFEKIVACAEKIKSDSEVLVVIGIGGSYLGAKSAIDMLNHSFYNALASKKGGYPQIYFAGNNISPVYLRDLLEVLGERDISVNVISKSGTTTEPAIAFRVFKDYMEKRYGKDGARKRIYATTDKSRGALKKLADSEGYETFVIPDDVGGRYSVLTAVGLLPIAASGVNIGEIIRGARDGMEEYSNIDIYKNTAYLYAALRNTLYKKGKTIEIMAGFEPSMRYFAEWWKQLYGESEGKNNLGIFPASVDFTADLHSMGQYIQEGIRNLSETFISIEKLRYDFEIGNDRENVDGLNFLSGRTMDYVNKRAMEGTSLAHADGGVPNIMINIPEINPYYYGKLVYMFEKACGISGYVLGVNPFDQPGVEEYKKNMFALLGKPGYEDKKSELENRMK
jgi:glucose-6-phosphate isomerase